MCYDRTLDLSAGSAEWPQGGFPREKQSRKRSIIGPR